MMKRRTAVLGLAVLGLAALMGCGDGSSEEDATAADKIVCKRAYSAAFVPGTTLDTPDDMRREWNRIAEASQDAHPEFKEQVLAVQEEVEAGIAYFEDHSITDDANGARTLYRELMDMCADRNYDLEYEN